MEKVRPWCSQFLDRGRLKNRTVGKQLNQVKLKKRGISVAFVPSPFAYRNALSYGMFINVTSQ